jgi:hypothetical protein
MVKPWLVRLELARDDGGSLSEDGIRELTDLLTRGAERDANESSLHVHRCVVLERVR